MKAVRKNMVRLTRRSFRRKLVIFGVSVFASLALTATGFAAWVLSTDAMAETQGGVEVGAVSDAGVEIKDLVFLDKNGDSPITNFRFDPAAGDTDGRVRVDEDGNAEDMDIRIGWTIKNYHNVKSSHLEFKIPASVYAAVQKGYLALPELFVLKTTGDLVSNTAVTEVIDGVEYYIYECDVSKLVTNNNTNNGLISWTKDVQQGNTNVTFELNLKFNWGATFKGQNPSIYYDTTYSDDSTAGSAVDYQVMKSTLVDLKLCTFGIADNETNRNAALAKIQNTEIRNSVKTADLNTIVCAMSLEEQEAFYANFTMPTYKLVIHALVN